jgi:hypothetical protein
VRFANNNNIRCGSMAAIGRPKPANRLGTETFAYPPGGAIFHVKRLIFKVSSVVFATLSPSGLPLRSRTVRWIACPANPLQSEIAARETGAAPLIADLVRLFLKWARVADDPCRRP